MRESFGGTALFMIVIFFVVIFIGYLCLSINQTRAFNVKNSIVRVVERHGVGINNISELDTPQFKADITKELEEVGYRTKGQCGNAQGYDAAGNETSTDPVFCIEYVSAGNEGSTNPNKNLHYFKVTTFYHFDLPVFRSVFRLTVKGDTKAMR